ncbi:MAG TPA: efflux RND transporter periplasmic adaptor subunit [Xanthobacteraceae bacterium]|jgi:RND family efflux transporter MFP subunit|nr:efflux RND transporter periplasmic adaptor subunit [Xanthobacteraceae bacterium]
MSISLPHFPYRHAPARMPRLTDAPVPGHRKTDHPMPRLACSAPLNTSRRPALPHRLLVGALFAGALVAPQFIPPALAEAPAAEAVKGLTVSVTHPEKREMVETLLVTGSLIAREEIQVGPEIEGYRLTEILAEVGDRVKQGQVLARLNREVLETQLAQNTANRAKAKAAIAQQRANLDQMLAQEAEATSAVERSRQLRKTGVVSQETLDERERAVKVASAQVAATREALAASEADAGLVEAQRSEIALKLTRTEVKAPAAGVVLARDARIGAIVLSTKSEPLFRIARDGAIDLDAEVPESAMPRMQVGQSVAVTPAGFSAPLSGKVRLISAQIDKSTRLGKVEIALAHDDRLRPGTYGRGLIEIARREGLAVPQSAVMFDAKGAYVLVVKDGIVAERRVEPGLKGEGRIELVSGVGAEDLVVVRAGGFLREGDRVTAVEADRTAGAK